MSYISLGQFSADFDMDDELWAFYVVDATSGSISVSMQTINVDGIWIYIQRTDTNATNTVTLVPKTGQTINGASSYNLLIGERVMCVSLATAQNYLLV